MASIVMPAELGSPQRHSRGQPGGHSSPPATVFGMGNSKVDAILRMSLFVSSLVAVIVMVTSQQTKNIYVAAYNIQVPILAKYNQVPAFIYFVVALAVASFYGITTTLLVTLKPSLSTKLSLQIVFLDTVLLSIVVAAIGATGGVGYIGEYGNKYTGWDKICNTYGSYCKQVLGSLLVSIFSAVILIFIVLCSFISLSKRVSK
ncbi:hypothetical protein ACFE04_014555 [Oxalis oulophora]